MEKYTSSILEDIGGTPLLKARNPDTEKGGLFLKLENQNPA